MVTPPPSHTRSHSFIHTHPLHTPTTHREQLRDPIQYILSIENEAKNFGIALIIIPPELAKMSPHHHHADQNNKRAWSDDLKEEVKISCHSFMRGYPKPSTWCAQLGKRPFERVSSSYDLLGLWMGWVWYCSSDWCVGVVSRGYSSHTYTHTHMNPHRHTTN